MLLKILIDDFLISDNFTIIFQSKALVISRFSESQEQKLCKLFSALSLQNKKPSQLLREMMLLAPPGTPEMILHTFWLNCMPISVKCILSASPNSNLSQLADIADKILAQNSETSEIDAITKHYQPESHHQSFNNRLSRLEEQLGEIVSLMKHKENTPNSSNEVYNGLQARTNHLSQHIPRANASTHMNPEHSNTSTVQPPATTKLWYYHQRFGSNSFSIQFEVFGKLDRVSSNEAVSDTLFFTNSLKTKKRLYIEERCNKLQFLIDSGSDFSVISKDLMKNQSQSS